jgi:hypothetical protein
VWGLTISAHPLDLAPIEPVPHALSDARRRLVLGDGATNVGAC